MAKKNWILVSTKRFEEEFSFKTIVECTFSKKSVSHWKSEYEIDYSVNSVCNGKIVNENSIWIVEACSLDEARSIATKHFANVSGFNIRNIKKVWSYSPIQRVTYREFYKGILIPSLPRITFPTNAF